MRCARRRWSCRSFHSQQRLCPACHVTGAAKRHSLPTVPTVLTVLPACPAPAAARVQDAISDKLGAFLQGVACFVGGMVVAFMRGWDLSLVVLAAIPAVILFTGICGIFTARLQACRRRRSAALHACHEL